MARTPEELRQITDPVARIEAARAAEAEARQEAHEAYIEVQAEAVRELLVGRKLADVAKLLGVTPQRVHQMSRGER